MATAAMAMGSCPFWMGMPPARSARAPSGRAGAPSRSRRPPSRRGLRHPDGGLALPDGGGALPASGALERFGGEAGGGFEVVEGGADVVGQETVDRHRELGLQGRAFLTPFPRVRLR